LRLRRLGLEFRERHDEPFARARILDLRAPVRHAHGLVPEQNEDTPVVEDSIADPHFEATEVEDTAVRRASAGAKPAQIP
jgi:hypothetical protein